MAPAYFLWHPFVLGVLRAVFLDCVLPSFSSRSTRKITSGRHSRPYYAKSLSPLSPALMRCIPAPRGCTITLLTFDRLIKPTHQPNSNPALPEHGSPSSVAVKDGVVSPFHGYYRLSSAWRSTFCHNLMSRLDVPSRQLVFPLFWYKGPTLFHRFIAVILSHHLSRPQPSLILLVSFRSHSCVPQLQSSCLLFLEQRPSSHHPSPVVKARTPLRPFAS